MGIAQSLLPEFDNEMKGTRACAGAGAGGQPAVETA
jgi:hypothetical protein